jgi:hypothetical protein
MTVTKCRGRIRVAGDEVPNAGFRVFISCEVEKNSFKPINLRNGFSTRKQAAAWGNTSDAYNESVRVIGIVENWKEN